MPRVKKELPEYKGPITEDEEAYIESLPVDRRPLFSVVEFGSIITDEAIATGDAEVAKLREAKQKAKEVLIDAKAAYRECGLAAKTASRALDREKHKRMILGEIRDVIRERDDVS